MSKFTSFIALILLSLSAILSTSCDSYSVKKLKKQVEMANAQCPINGGSGGDLISIKYDKKYNQVIYYWSINEKFTTIDFLRSSEEDVLNQMKLMFQENSARDMIKDLIRAEASLKVVYKSPSTGKTAEFMFSVDDLKNIQNSPRMTKEDQQRMIVNNQIKLENKKCPYTVDEGMRMTRVDLVNDNMVYYCEVDEDLYDFSQIQFAEAEIAKAVKEELKENLKTDVLLQQQCTMMHQLGMGIHYRYYGNKSQKTYDVIISPQELYTFLPKRLRN